MSAITVNVRPDAVAVLTFDQPDSRANVLSRELWSEFGDALAALAARTDLKGLVLASAKPGIFIAGADLKLLASAPGPNDPEVRAFIEQGLRVLEQLEALPFPTCAAIDGAALGGGLEVALACDYRACGTNPKVQLGLPEVKLGLIPGWGGTQRLPRLVGAERSVQMLTSGASLNAPDAVQCGLVGSLADSAQLVDSAANFLAHTSDSNSARQARFGPVANAALPPQPQLSGAAAEAVRVVVEGAALPLRAAIGVETEAFMRLAGGDDSKRLIAEFFAARKK
jgi:enoyl-CoA hydratase/carnithine racemase